MSETESSFLERLGIYFLIFIFISGLFEIGLLIFAYVNADEVECNWLWCTFTTKETSSISNSYTSISSSSECFVNGFEVNCSDFPSKDYSHFYNNGKIEMNGVCPGISNKTVEECIKELLR